MYTATRIFLGVCRARSAGLRLFPLMALLLLLLSPVQVPAAVTLEPAGCVTCRVEPGEYRITEENGVQEIRLDGFGVIGEPGKPRLPGKIFAIAIPPGAEPVTVRVDGGVPVEMDGTFRISPVSLTRPMGREDPAVQARREAAWQLAYEETYGRDDVYPAEPGWLVRRAGFRKYNLVDVRIAPFSFRPESGRLYVHPRITITVDYRFPDAAGLPSGGQIQPGTVMIDHVPEMEKTARELILNYREAQAWYPEPPAPQPTETHDFVIVTLESLVSEVAPLVNHETLKSRSPEVVTVEWISANYDGTDLPARIRSFLREKYPSSAWGIRDVLLVGDHQDLPLRECWIDAGYGLPFSDFYYAELSEADEDSWDADGDQHYGEDNQDNVDLYNEVNIGRIPWSNGGVVRQACEKAAAFELNVDPAYKKNIMVLGAFFWADTDTAWLMEAKLDQPWMADWSVTRMYEDNADYASAFPMDQALNRDNVVAAWSTGRYCMVNTAGHGSSFSSHILGEGNPAFIQAIDVNYYNDQHPAIVWADACLTADPTVSNLGKQMMRHGAVGYLGSTQVADGQPGWRGPEDGSTQTLDYWFTLKVTSGEMSQGEAHQWAMRKLYQAGLWAWPSYEMFEWTLYGNPNLGLGMTTEASLIVSGPGPAAANPPLVRIFPPGQDAAYISEFQAYASQHYGVNLTCCDLDGDQLDEIITGAGPGEIYGPHVRGFRVNGTPLPGLSFMAYGTSKFGANVAAGDLNGDGRDEILTGAGPGAVFGPHVRGWNYNGPSGVTPLTGVSYFAYVTPKWGVRVSAGDIDGDGCDEIITGAGPGAVYGPHVRGWDVDGGPATAMPGVSFLAYGTLKYGVNVSSGDVDGDGIDEIVTGAGPGAVFSPHVRGWNYDGSSITPLPGLSFFAWDAVRFGASVFAGADLNGDDRAELVVGCGPDPDAGTPVKVFLYDGQNVTEWFSLQAFTGMTQGTNVAAGRF